MRISLTDTTHEAITVSEIPEFDLRQLGLCEKLRAIRRSIPVNSNCKQIDDGGTTLENEGHSAFETSEQFTHIRRRYPRRHPGYVKNYCSCIFTMFFTNTNEAV